MAYSFGLGKKRSKFGKFLDKHRIEQEQIVKSSGVGRTTISRAASDPDYIPTKTIQKQIVRGIKRFNSMEVDITDFWN